MDQSLEESLKTYEDQLEQVDAALEISDEQSERDDLTSLRKDLSELISLTKKTISSTSLSSPSTAGNHSNTAHSDEFSLFMAEMEKEGAVSRSSTDSSEDKAVVALNEELKSLEGSKCRAPHKHNWGDVVYHNAMICSVSSSNGQDDKDVEVKVLFTNPTHQEMLPCPYFLDMECKFSDEKCKYSHGETVLFSSLQEYIEPKFEALTIGSRVLAKRPDNLWHRAIVKRMNEDKCAVSFEQNKKHTELQLHDVLPLEDDGTCSSSEDSGSEEEGILASEDVINMSLLNAAGDQALGGWEKHTKGIGSKLMQKMGYVFGTGLGPKAEGRIEPVTAVILPPGKSLDHCMELKEKAGGDKNLFSAERKLKRLQKQQEIRNQKIYENRKKKVDVFSLLNETILNTPKAEQDSTSRRKHREEIRKETSRSLNVASLRIEEDMKRIEREMCKIRESLTRHSDTRSSMNKNLKGQLVTKQSELEALQAKALNIKNEQSNRSDKKKLTVF